MFQKPKEICHYSSDLENIITDVDIKSFAKNTQLEIEQNIAELGLKLRRAELNDHYAINQLLFERFHPNTASQISFYDANLLNEI